MAFRQAELGASELLTKADCSSPSVYQNVSGLSESVSWINSNPTAQATILVLNYRDADGKERLLARPQLPASQQGKLIDFISGSELTRQQFEGQMISQRLKLIGKKQSFRLESFPPLPSEPLSEGIERRGKKKNGPRMGELITKETLLFKENVIAIASQTIRSAPLYSMKMKHDLSAFDMACQKLGTFDAEFSDGKDKWIVTEYLGDGLFAAGKRKKLGGLKSSTIVINIWDMKTINGIDILSLKSHSLISSSRPITVSAQSQMAIPEEDNPLGFRSSSKAKIGKKTESQVYEELLLAMRSAIDRYSKEKVVGSADVVQRLLAIHNAVQSDIGMLGIKYEISGDHPEKKNFRGLDVFANKRGDCNEISYLFMMAVRALVPDALAYAVDVDVDDRGDKVGHMCVGVFVRSDEKRFEPYGFNSRFDYDSTFRKKTLDKLGIADSKDLHMLLIDPTYNTYDITHQQFEVLNDSESAAIFHGERGSIQYFNLNHSEAIKSFKKAIEFNPNRISLYLELAECTANQGNGRTGLPEAISILKTALSVAQAQGKTDDVLRIEGDISNFQYSLNHPPPKIATISPPKKSRKK